MQKNDRISINTFKNYNAFWKTPYNIIVRSESIEDGVTPSSNQFMGIEFRDKNDARVGWIGLAKLTDGTQRIELQKQGSTSCFVTQPSDAYSSIVTTIGINKSLNGYVKLGNGLIIQWGLVTNMSNCRATVNFPIPFTDIPQVTTTSDYSGVADGYNSYVSNISSTSFYAYNKMYGSSLNCWVRWIAVGY